MVGYEIGSWEGTFLVAGTHKEKEKNVETRRENRASNFGLLRKIGWIRPDEVSKKH